jgi:hypothetical protein
MITSGELARRVADEDLRGITSNPAIFEKAITGSVFSAGTIPHDFSQKCELRHASYR